MHDEMMEHDEPLASALMKGVAAGVAGAAAMTLSQAIEKKLSGRAASTAPADVAHAVTGVDIDTPDRAAHVSTAMQWNLGVTSGVIRGLMGASGHHGAAAAAAHFALLWGGDRALEAATGAACLPWAMSGGELATDALHKAVLSGVTSTVYELLEA